MAGGRGGGGGLWAGGGGAGGRRVVSLNALSLTYNLSCLRSRYDTNLSQTAVVIRAVGFETTRTLGFQPPSHRFPKRSANVQVTRANPPHTHR